MAMVETIGSEKKELLKQEHLRQMHKKSHDRQVRCECGNCVTVKCVEATG